MRRLGLPCWLCGKPIDYTLSMPDPMSFSADHVAPVALGGDNLGDLKPAHYGCNSSRGTKDPRGQLPTSRNWLG